MAWAIDEVVGSDAAAVKQAVARSLRGECAGFRVPDFASPAQCAALAGLVEAHAAQVESYAARNVKAAHLGVPAIRHARDAAQYFAAARQWNDWQRNIGGWNAGGAVVELLARAFPDFSCNVAQDATQGHYFHGIIRQIDRSPLHNDFAHRDFPGWAIAAASQQLAWNIYLTAAPQGDGETIIHDRLWEPAHESFKNSDAMGYADDVVAGARHVRYAPRRGELMVFNCVNYHEVTWTRGGGTRLSVGGFIGFDAQGRSIRFWS